MGKKTYFPIQKLEKICPKTSSFDISQVMAAKLCKVWRISKAIKSLVFPILSPMIESIQVVPLNFLFGLHSD